ncbi:phage terminase small subunit [Testudinibacter sp. P27/CKL/0425]
MRPTKAHFLRVSAEQESSAQAETLDGATAYELMLHQLAVHKRTLKQIQSKEAKAEFKAKILPEYLPWIEGALEKGTGYQDNVLMTWLTWAIDCGDYQLAIRIGDYALFHDLILPDGFSRTTGTLIAEEFADKAKIARDIKAEFDLGLLVNVNDITAEQDMPDEVRSKLLKEIGLLQKEHNPIAALENLKRAMELNNNVGVKQDIDKLTKVVDKLQAEQAANTE